MGYTAPTTRATDYVVTAIDWNIIVNDILALAAVLDWQTAYVGATETTSSTSFTNLGTVGPSVTLTTGTKAIAFVSGKLSNNTAGNSASMGVAVSGATTIVASDRYSLEVTTAANYGQRVGTILPIDGLTAGTNTFTAKYKVSSGATTGTFLDRTILVVPFGLT